MKKLKILSGLMITLIAFSCSKSNNNVVPAASSTNVNINGIAYPTVTIGKQIWTAQNYRGPGGGEIQTNGSDSVTNGNYYSSTAINLPAGWRVPTRADFNQLLTNYSSTLTTEGDVLVDLDHTEALISKTGWLTLTGSNSTGFNAYPAGFIYGVGDASRAPHYKGDYTTFLSGTTDPASMGIYFLQIQDQQESYNGNSFYTTVGLAEPLATGGNIGLSVRFVKDK